MRNLSAPRRAGTEAIPKIQPGTAASFNGRYLRISSLLGGVGILFAVMGLWLVALLLIPAKARCVEIIPFYTQNQSPVVQIFGLPAAGDAKVLQKGKFRALLAADVASDFAEDATLRENILLDGENYRFTLALRYGITDRF